MNMKGYKPVNALITVISITLILLGTLYMPVMADSSEHVEEEAETVLENDSVISGPMDEHSKKFISVDGIRYRFCKNVKVFGMQDQLISVNDLDAAEDVKLFMNKRCVRKIKVVRFAQ
jgi:hypothetical protein